MMIVDGMYVEELENLAILYHVFNYTISLTLNEIFNAGKCFVRMPRRMYKRVRQDDH